ncbi:glycosyltransferase family 2 protein [Flavobacterium sp. 7A]|uniref:glycosyltransferase family 2 protein n=1 Tax=Flavobacterium sp. 7A TaxID=2940571 RepID=UPI002226C29E|nr:glycosyltransferase [Flavobacterium sp. 7A]MCW2120591.1 hypothetical protein [Flavobacterium sp. 7A]
MLSILIPTYNYNVYPLVTILKVEAEVLEINYEILVQDDASQEYLCENSKINTLKGCNYTINSHNLGRGKNINMLCSKSKYDYILILESDSLPNNSSYLKNYINLLSKSPEVIFGGVEYPNNTPESKKILRWKYGRNRECKSLNHRLKNNYDFVFTWNLLLKKDILIKYPFPEYINDYGYEDSIFIKTLRIHSISINHIENQLTHCNDQFSIEFIKKTERAVQTLFNLNNNNKIDSKDIKLTLIYSILKRVYLTGVLKLIYSISKKRILNNLTSQKPSLFLFDLYKLGYYCNLQK